MRFLGLTTTSCNYSTTVRAQKAIIGSDLVGILRVVIVAEALFILSIFETKRQQRFL